MRERTALVVTSISAPNTTLASLAGGARQRQIPFYLIGDSKSPTDFSLPDCEFYSLERQRQLEFEYARLVPPRHYSRKNIGYLLAMAGGAEIILETDDDNKPREEFWQQPVRSVRTSSLQDAGWVNAYRYFSDELIWPRGFPLQHVKTDQPPFEALVAEDCDCPIQQGLADGDPDVDAIYRLLLPLPISFRRDRSVAFGPGSWTPFNSQNTRWWADAFPLMYLPTYCSFRMTDIWRSFVAQRIASENGWSVLFYGPTVWQERNEHKLMLDFAEEIPGYLENEKICEALGSVPVRSGIQYLAENLLNCYECLTRIKAIDSKELSLLEAWNSDIWTIRSANDQNLVTKITMALGSDRFGAASANS